MHWVLQMALDPNPRPRTTPAPTLRPFFGIVDDEAMAALASPREACAAARSFCKKNPRRTPLLSRLKKSMTSLLYPAGSGGRSRFPGGLKSTRREDSRHSYHLGQAP